MLYDLPNTILINIINNKLGLSISIQHKKIIDSCKLFRLLTQSTWYNNTYINQFKLENKLN